jgi:YhcH/YjgK/YiaL family protein
MIIDKIENWPLYPLGSAWQTAFEFLATLTPQSEEKKYNLQGDDIFAMVMGYETQTPEHAILESHQKYVDIQAVLHGGERFECASRDDLSIKTPYDVRKDVEFYQTTSRRPFKVDVMPGTFIMLYPQDAHMPTLMINDQPEQIKKVVIKIKLELLR